MNISCLVLGYGQHGYEVLARTSQLEPWIEDLFFEVRERWPFSEKRESLVLTRYEQTSSEVCCVLAKSRMSLGEPIHRQTVFALFRLDELVQRWSGFIPLVKLLPPYTPEGSVIPDITFRNWGKDLFADPVSSDCDVNWHDLKLNREWLLDSWIRLAMGEVIELPSCNDKLEMEISVADLLAWTLPVRCRVNMKLSFGMRRGGTLSVGPGMTSASSIAPSNLPRTYRQAQSPALKKWLDHAVAGSEQGVGLEETARAIRAALVEATSQTGLKNEADLDVPHLEKLGHRYLLIDWLTSGQQNQDLEAVEIDGTLLWNPTELHKTLRTIREHLDVVPAPNCRRIGKWLLRVVRCMNPSRPVNKDVATETADMLFKMDLRCLQDKRQMSHALPEIVYPRIVPAGPGFPDAIEVYYWRITTRWLIEKVHSRAVNIGPLLARPWSKEMRRFDYQKPSLWPYSTSKRAWDMLIDASGGSDLRHDKDKIKAASPVMSSDPRGIECLIESFVAAILDIAPRDFELRESVYELLWTIRKRDTL